MREAHGGKSWIPQNDAEEKQDLAEAQTITCDQFLHLLLTNYQQGTICYRQDNPDVERGIRTRLENDPGNDFLPELQSV